MARITVFSAILLTVACCFPTHLAAAQLVARPGDSLAPLLDALKPGDTLLLTQGTYKAGKNWITNKRGTKDAWFTVRGQENAKVIIENQYHENTFTLKDCSFWKFENLEITGKIGGDCFKWTGVNSDMVIANCNLHDIDGAGINCSSIEKMERLTVTHCQIYNTGGMGEGMYLGHDGGPQAVCDSIFEYNLIHDTAGKPKDGAMGDGIEINQGGNGNIIRFNVIYNTWLPCITIENTRGKANLVEGNILWNAKSDNELHINGAAVVRNNLIVSSKAGTNFGSGVSEGGNTIMQARDISPEDLLKRGLEMLKLDPLVHGKVGLGGKNGGGDANAALLAHLKGDHPAGENGDGSNPATPPPAPTRQWDEKAIANLREECIGRLVKLSQTPPDLYLSILIAGEPQQVSLLPSTVKEGLVVKLVYGGKKALAWADLSTAMLGETLLALCDADPDGGLLEDRLRVALCYYAADRQVPAAQQVEKIAALDKELAGQYPARVALLNPAIAK